MMNYYTSKLESSYMIAKEEIAQLTARFKDAFHRNSTTTNTNQINIGTFRTNPNIIIDPVVVRTKGSRQVGSQSEGSEVEALMGSGQRPRQCSICKGVGHDACNCMDCERVRKSQEGASTSYNTIDHIQDSTQESLQSSDHMY